MYKDSDGQLIVMEGNRRLTALKLLNQIDIIPSNNITNKIKKITKVTSNIPDSLSCVVFDRDETFEHWINLKHTGANGGAGRVQWTGQEVDRHKAKNGNTSFGNQLLTFIGKEVRIPASIKTNTQKLYITNINRLLDDPDVRKFLSLEPTNGALYCYQSKDNFIEDITRILTCMLEVDEKGKVQFTVDRIKVKKDRAIFLSQLNVAIPENKLEKPWKLTTPESYADVEKSGKPKTNSDKPKITNTSKNNSKDKETSPKEGNTSAQEPSQKTKTKTKTKKSANANPNRNMLVPINVVLSIPDKKCNGVFKELKNKLKHDDQPHSIAVMFRVFLELSLSYYLKNNSIRLDNRKKGLHDKVVAVSNFLRESKKISGSQCTAIQATSNDISKRAGALQQYVHNNHMFPDRASLNTNWDNLEPLFVGIWS